MVEPGLWKLEPVALTKPWGLVHDGVRRLTRIKAGIGELWLASAQSGPGNYSNLIVEPPLHATLRDTLRRAADEGQRVLRDLLGARAISHTLDRPTRGKTEAWCVRHVSGRTGVAAGPRSAHQLKRLQHIIQTRGLKPDVDSWSDEVRDLMGVIEPLCGGEVFLTPAGSLHTMFAAGADSVLVIDELQQGYGESLLPVLSKVLMVQNDILSVQVHPDDHTVSEAVAGRLEVGQDLLTNPTVRVYDFGRRPGEEPELGFTLVSPNAGLRLVSPVRVEPAPGHLVEAMVADLHFVRCRVSLRPGLERRLEPLYGSFRVLHCLAGSGSLSADGDRMALSAGETVFVPARLEDVVSVRAEEEMVFFDDALPDLSTLSGFLGGHGAAVDAVEALLKPPRALRAP